MAKRMYVIKKNKRYVMDDSICGSFTKNINKAAIYRLKGEAASMVLDGEIIVKVQISKHGKLVEI